MADGLLVKVQFPPGSLKKTATVKLVADGTVAAAVQEIAKAGHLSRPEQYLIYCAEGTKRKWLIETQTLAEAGITAQVREEEGRNWGNIDMESWRCVLVYGHSGGLLSFDEVEERILF